jgi:predicted ATP-dependent serine protease
MLTLVDLNDKITSGNLADYQPVPLGFTPLDKTIGGGLRAGELLLIGGAQGTGKTTMEFMDWVATLEDIEGTESAPLEPSENPPAIG